MSKGYFTNWNAALPKLKQGILDNTEVVYEGTLSVAEVEKNWEYQELICKNWEGILEVTTEQSKYGYGALFYKEKLPADLVVTFNYMFPADCAHDMDFIFPFKEKQIMTWNEMQDDPHKLCLWSIGGWGGLMTGVEVPDTTVPNTQSRTQFNPEPGIMHCATWARQGNVQTLIIDGKLIFNGAMPGIAISTEPGYFAFNIYGAGSKKILGDVRISKYTS